MAKKKIILPYTADETTRPAAPIATPQAAIARALVMARHKGLKVQLCLLESGWSIGLPNGSHYHAKSNEDMCSYVKGY